MGAAAVSELMGLEVTLAVSELIDFEVKPAVGAAPGTTTAG